MTVQKMQVGATVNINGRMFHWDGFELIDLQTKTKFSSDLDFCHIDDTTRWSRPNLIVDNQAICLQLQPRRSPYFAETSRMFKFSEELRAESEF